MAWKRASIVAWVVSYICFVGVPVWWKSTSIERPVFKTGTKALFESLSKSITGLPATFHVSIASHGTSGGSCSPDSSRQQESEAGDSRKQDGQCSSTPPELEAIRAQLQDLLDRAAVPDDDPAADDSIAGTGSLAGSTVLHVDTMHLSSSTCMPTQPPPGDDTCGTACGHSVTVPCAALPLLTAGPPHAQTPPASSRDAQSDDAPGPANPSANPGALVRHLDRAMDEAPSQPCPGSHHVLLIPDPTCGGSSGHPRAHTAPSAWITSGRRTFVWLPCSSVTPAALDAVGRVFHVIMHGVHVSDLQPIGTPSGSGNAAPCCGAGDCANSAGGGLGLDAARREPRRKLPISAASELSAVFTLAVAEPEPGNLPDSLGQVVEVAWGPAVRRLQPLADVRLESQARLYARARLLNTAAGAAHPTHGVTITPEALPFFVDTDAWSLEHGRMIAGHVHPLSSDSHGIPENILHFVGYLPPPGERPMRIQCGTGDCAGFKIAGWGGVTILNAEDHRRDLPLFLGTAMQQFRELLGLPPARDWDVVGAPRCGTDGGEGARVAVVSPEVNGVALWEVDVLMRQRYVQLLAETGAAVTALLDMVATLDSLEIPAFIGTKVERAKLRTLEAVHAGNQGDYKFAVKQARAGRVDAEVALTHHAIASQHSYPFQHKIAVYLPLFAPLSLPIMAAIVVEFRRKLPWPRD